jgi:calcineurin-like phosphoesterase family protein
MCKRPFDTVEEMNAALIVNWNSYITDYDDIYILGDFLFKRRGKDANSLLKSLKGRKYFIRGNHDSCFLDDPGFDASAFVWVKDYHVLNYQNRLFVLFHYPILEWHAFYHSAVHLYGHIHNCGNDLEHLQRFATVLGRRAVNVGVDVQNFCPISIKDVIKIADGTV